MFARIVGLILYTYLYFTYVCTRSDVHTHGRGSRLQDSGGDNLLYRCSIRGQSNLSPEPGFLSRVEQPFREIQKGLNSSYLKSRYEHIYLLELIRSCSGNLSGMEGDLNPINSKCLFQDIHELIKELVETFSLPHYQY
jgi:hypothetical protein